VKAILAYRWIKDRLKLSINAYAQKKTAPHRTITFDEVITVHHVDGSDTVFDSDAYKTAGRLNAPYSLLDREKTNDAIRLEQCNVYLRFAVRSRYLMSIHNFIYF
jgi:hypothetical protein